MEKINTKDWANIAPADWNSTTVTSYLEHLTKESAGVTYEPTGGGSKSQRWAREKGMMKRALDKYGAEVVKRFIELCFTRHTPKKEYPYPSFTFAYSYMSDQFPVAEAEIAKGRRMAAESERSGIANGTNETKVDEGWF